jgi:hypothetical protein
MRVGMVACVLCVVAVNVIAAPVTYPLLVDSDRSNIQITIGLQQRDPDTGAILVDIPSTVSSRVGGTLDLAVDQDAQTAQVTQLNVHFLDQVTIFLDGTSVIVDPETGDNLGWVSITTPWEGSTPLTLTSNVNGGPGSYDGSGNVTFPGVKIAMAGVGWLDGGGTLGGLLAFYLGITPPGLVDLAGLGLDFTSDLTGTVNPSLPSVAIPVNISGETEVLSGLFVTYAVNGEIATVVPEPITGGLFVLGLSALGAWSRRRSA